MADAPRSQRGTHPYSLEAYTAEPWHWEYNPPSTGAAYFLAARLGGGGTREIREAARAFSLPVLYDVMGEVSVTELLAGEYPDVSFIIPHLGSFADESRRSYTVSEAASVLYKSPA